MTNMRTRPILIVDGNSALVRSHFALAGSNLRTSSGTPVWAIKGMWNLITAAINRVDAAGVLLTFDSGRTFRSERYPQYKAGRAEKDADLRTQIAAAPTHFRNAGLPVAAIDGYEADDLLAAAAHTYTHGQQRVVLLTSDRDSFALITDTCAEHADTRVLRMINGGAYNWPLLTPSRLHSMYGVYPHEYRLYAAIRGDSSDNLPGVTGIGEKTATKLVAYLRATQISFDTALADLDAGGSILSDAIGSAAARKFSNPQSRVNLARNRDLMTPVDTLPVPDLDTVTTGINREAFLTETRAWELTIPETIVAPAQHTTPAITPPRIPQPVTEPALTLFS